MNNYKIKFFETFDPHIIEEYKDEIFTLNSKYSYINEEPRKFRGEHASYCYENKYLEVGQKITLRINKTEYKDFNYLNLIQDKKTWKYNKIQTDYHVLYPLFGMYLHILLEFTDGNLELVKNKIKITHEFQKKYQNNVIYLKTVINSIDRGIDLNTLIFNLNPTSGDVILWAYNYYKIRDGLNRNNFMETLLSMSKYFFNVDSVKFKNLRGKKMIIDFETGEKKKILSNLYYCLAMDVILLTYTNSFMDFISDIDHQIWLAISNSDLYESDLYYAFVRCFWSSLNVIENNDYLVGKADGFALRDNFI